MEFRKSLLSAAAAAAVLAFAGGSFAADDTKSPTSAPDPTATGHSSQQSVGTPADPVTSAKPSSSMDSSSGSSGSSPSATTGSSSSGLETSGAMQSSQASSPPGFIVGKSVTNAQGDKIGTVSKVDGNNVVISVGGFLGIGSHDVSVPYSQLTLSGTGDDAKLQTALTRDELKAMPEITDSESSRGGTRSSGSMGGSTGQGTTGSSSMGGGGIDSNRAR